MAAFGREIDLRDPAVLARGMRPRFPMFAKAPDGVGGSHGAGGVRRAGGVPDVPAGGGDHSEIFFVNPFDEQGGVNGDVRVERDVEEKGADKPKGSGRGSLIS